MTARDAGGTAYLVVKRRLRRVRSARIPLSHILYCSAPDVLARNLERIKLAIIGHVRAHTAPSVRPPA
jgi:acetoacetyl-CoA synthetase